MHHRDKVYENTVAKEIYDEYINKNYLPEDLKGGYFLEGEIWIGYNVSGEELFVEEFNKKEEAKNYANGKQAINRYGDYLLGDEDLFGR